MPATLYDSNVPTVHDDGEVLPNRSQPRLKPQDKLMFAKFSMKNTNPIISHMLKRDMRRNKGSFILERDTCLNSTSSSMAVFRAAGTIFSSRSPKELS